MREGYAYSAALFRDPGDDGGVAPKGLTIKAALRWKGDRTRRVPRRLRGRRDGAALGLGALVLQCAASNFDLVLRDP